MGQYTKQNKNNIQKAISKLGIKETENLLKSFLSGPPINLNGDSGIICASFCGYYDQHEDEDENSIIKGFISMWNIK